MFVFEQLTTTYFAALAAAALLTRTAMPGTRRTVLVAGVAAAFVLGSSRILSTDARAWLAHAYLVAGYWLPVRLVTNHTPNRFEAWLIQSDARWQRGNLHLPTSLRSVAELSYFLCYPMVPAAFTVVWMFAPESAVDRFWTSVIGAGFLCFGCLPWLTSRPPQRATPARDVAIGRFNKAVLKRVSHGLNTFPSGHVAVSVAVTLNVIPIWWPAGLLLGLLSIGIAIGAVAGRHHYGADVVAGAAVGIVVRIVTGAG